MAKGRTKHRSYARWAALFFALSQGVMCTGAHAALSPRQDTSQAGKLTITLSRGEAVNHQEVRYQCGLDEKKASDDQKSLMTSLPSGGRFSVSYVNADLTALAIVPADSKMLVFANVIAGSGAKYVADRYEWWTQGDEATFSRVDKEDDSITCHVVTPETSAKAASASKDGASVPSDASHTTPKHDSAGQKNAQ